jgi:hypothetical protein
MAVEETPTCTTQPAVFSRGEIGVAYDMTEELCVLIPMNTGAYYMKSVCCDVWVSHSSDEEK